uniref:Ubiquinol-cytochrome-c reductase complex assembly factor 1 n=3 Tax=Cacopsylla melanoneura TaxID=428564 RepID=A0A8D9BS58_9HEMI
MNLSSLCRVYSQMRPACYIKHLVVLNQRPSLCYSSHLVQQYYDPSRGITTCNQFNQLTKTTGAEYLSENKSPWIKSIIKKLGWKFVIKGKFSMMGYELYESLLKNMDYLQFFKDFEMDDTFHSWFLVVELHVWMLSVRVMRDEEFGKTVRDAIIQTMWSDVVERSQHMTVLQSTQTAQVKELSEEFRAAMINYDEGIQSDDKVLAGAIWRRFFCKNCDNPLLIERLVHYVRRQVYELEHTSNKALFMEKKLKLVNLADVTLSQ